MADTIATDNPLTPAETAAVAAIVGMMIPASEKYAVPGADDDTILADILGTAREHVDLLKAGLATLDRLANEVTFVELDGAARIALIEDRKEELDAFIRALTSMTVQCYYRDARVMASLGMEARPPFPEGFEVPQGDWSILDPVRDRGKVWRDA